MVVQLPSKFWGNKNALPSKAVESKILNDFTEDDVIVINNYKLSYLLGKENLIQEIFFIIKNIK